MKLSNDIRFENYILTPSEFLPGGYDIAYISKAMDTAINNVYEYFRQLNVVEYSNVFSRVVLYFNEEFVKGLDEESFHSIVEDAHRGLQKLNQLMAFEESISDEIIPKRNYTEILIGYYERVLKRFRNDKCFYDDELAKCYLESFFELSKNVVFCPDSNNITSSKFRKSSFLHTLVSFATKKIHCQAKCRDGITGRISSSEFSCYEVSYFDPFAYDTISRALSCAAGLIIDELHFQGNHSEELFELRKDMFICSFESAFQRVFTLDRQSYRVELNRHTSKLIAYPVEMQSSISDTKAIRLFEKTAAYIRSSFFQDNEDDNEIKIAILGHSEISRGEIESGMRDYLNEVLNWYDSLEIPQKPQLNLMIKNYLSYSGKPDVLDSAEYKLPERRNEINIPSRENTATCEFVKVDYELDFTYGLREIKKLINQNNLIFILDCPWLSTENYSIAKEESLNDYCNRLQKLRWNKPVKDISSLFYSNGFSSESPMAELNSQYNRIMSSTSLSTGSVVRSMRDDIIQKIQAYMEDLGKESNRRAKELYIFSSENKGVNYSYIQSYPLTRLEQYDGKHFTIIQFTTKRLPMLPCRNVKREKLRFEIDVWSILKYLCFSFAYKYPVNTLLNEIGFVLDDMDVSLFVNEPIKLLELMQNIVVVFELRNSLKKVNISMGFTNLFDNLIKSTSTDNEYYKFEVNIRKIKMGIRKKVLELIRPLYHDVVFEKSRHYGDDSIKLGFKMTLYSAARDVNTMLFYHLYEEACEKDDFSDFVITFDDSADYRQVNPRDYYNVSFFADKKLYCTLFNSFERDYRLYMGMVKMLLESEKIYEYDQYDTSEKRFIVNFEEKLFDNIQRACSQARLDNTIMFRNMRRAKSTLNL